MEKLPEQLHHSHRSIADRRERSSSSAQCCFNKLDSVLRFGKAVATIENDILKSPIVSPEKEVLGSVLHRRLKERLSETSLLPENIPERRSVIVYTPSRKPRTSTPLNSPPKQVSLNPPKSCEDLGPLQIHLPRSHSPSCPDIFD